jgi:hypothetical protein
MVTTLTLQHQMKTTSMQHIIACWLIAYKIIKMLQIAAHLLWQHGAIKHLLLKINNIL